MRDWKPGFIRDTSTRIWVLSESSLKVALTSENRKRQLSVGHVLINSCEEIYWGPNAARLRQLKAKYDPINMFANPQSVRLPDA